MRKKTNILSKTLYVRRSQVFAQCQIIILQRTATVTGILCFPLPFRLPGPHTIKRAFGWHPWWVNRCAWMLEINDIVADRHRCAVHRLFHSVKHDPTRSGKVKGKQAFSTFFSTPSAPYDHACVYMPLWTGQHVCTNARNHTFFGRSM